MKLLLVGLAVIWTTAGLTVVWLLDDAEGARGGASGQTCFPAERWDANPRHRPCLNVYDLAEDGSGTLYIERANHAGKRWSCQVPATDKRTPRRFKLRCKRIPRAGILPPWVER